MKAIKEGPLENPNLVFISIGFLEFHSRKQFCLSRAFVYGYTDPDPFLFLVRLLETQSFRVAGNTKFPDPY